MSYPLWIGVARVASARLDERFTGHLLNATALAVDIALIGLLVLFTRIDWLRLIARLTPSAPTGS